MTGLTFSLIAVGFVVIVSFFLSRISGRFGIPVLLAFLIFGFVSSLFFKGSFDGWPIAVDNICTVSLLFIMFYGGYGTRWKTTKPILAEASLLATFGVIITAIAVGFFCHFVMQWTWVQSFMLGAVVSSTDAATVFSILRGKKLGLKNNSAPLIEMESGANDPCAYVLAIVMLSIANSADGAAPGIWQIAQMILSQLGMGLVIGIGLGGVASYILKYFKKTSSSYDPLLILSIASLSYALAAASGGSGYLATYVTGVILGNTEFKSKKDTVKLFETFTMLLQVTIFFLLGTLASPSGLWAALVPAAIISVFMFLIARPLAVFSILSPFRKYSVKEMGFISTTGLRGASSLVFAGYTVTQVTAAGRDALSMGRIDILSVVFSIVLISVMFQGTMLPVFARMLDMVDSNNDVMKFFNDYSEDVDISFCRCTLPSNLPEDTKMSDLNLPLDVNVMLVERGGGRFIPDSDTLMKPDDVLMFCAKSMVDNVNTGLIEHKLSPHSKWIGKRIMDYPYRQGAVVVMIRRKGENIVPSEMTVLEKDDVLVILKQ